MKKYVIAFDICSSTVMLEDLAVNNRVEAMSGLIDGLYAFLNGKVNQYPLDVYKFTGDGFLLMMDESVSMDEVLSFCIALTYISRELLVWFKDEYLSIDELPREGITVGIAYGDTFRVESPNNRSTTEYVGRPLNLATRLQGKLNKPEHTNKVLFEKVLYKRIENELFSRSCRRTKRVLHNVSGDTPVGCYEFNPMPFVDTDWRIWESKSSATPDHPDLDEFLATLRGNLEKEIDTWIVQRVE